VDDEERGVEWYGCDGCERWYHGECLSVQELTLAVTSVCDGDDWTCKNVILGSMKSEDERISFVSCVCALYFMSLVHFVHEHRCLI